MAALVAYTLLGETGEHAHWLMRSAQAVAILLLIWSMIWHARRMQFVRFGLSQIQANKQTAARGVPGAFYFGAALGSGLLTKMSTPLVQVGALLAVACGPGWALSYGAAFAAGRSSPVWVGLLSGSRKEPHSVALAFIDRRTRLWVVGLAAAVLGVACALAAGPFRS